MNGRIRRIEIAKLYPDERRALLRRSPVPDAAVRSSAAEIVAAVRSGGDAALHHANRTYGGGRPLRRMRIEPGELAAAQQSLDPDVAAALSAAAANIRACHELQRPVDQPFEVVAGVSVERRWAPLRRVGVYVPGGKAAYPSSLLMGVIPAQVAGVAEIAVVSPANADGDVSPVLLGAAAMLGVEELYVTGGAQAVAALAYGTETVPRVDKIVGPGNAWVTAAKLAVYGDVAIDLPAGPSEALVIADESADPRVVAADLLCQAEHGPDSPAVLVATSPGVADQVVAAIADLLPALERAPILRAALGDAALIAVAADVDEAVAFANEYAPEHVGVQTVDAAAVARRLTGAGSVFVGPWAPHSAGDYATGANHVLPTGGLARAYGPLSVEDFGAWRQVQELTRDGLAALRDTITTIAAAEGLTAHRLAVDVRFEEERP
jgi:histidinol dehydrogenase